MASDIVSNGTFVVTNMKPDPGEQGDAIHQQKMAQNAGFVFGRKVGVGISVGTHGTETTSTGNPFSRDFRHETYFFRRPGHNKLDGTLSQVAAFGSLGASDCYYSMGIKIKGDTSSVQYYFSGTAANIGSNFDIGTIHTFTVDLNSYVPENTWGTVIGTFWGTSDDSVASRSIRTYMPLPALLTTYWG